MSTSGTTDAHTRHGKTTLCGYGRWNEGMKQRLRFLYLQLIYSKESAVLQQRRWVWVGGSCGALVAHAAWCPWKFHSNVCAIHFQHLEREYKIMCQVVKLRCGDIERKILNSVNKWPYQRHILIHYHISDEPTFPTGTFLTSSTNTTSLRGHCSSFTFSSSLGAGVERLRSASKYSTFIKSSDCGTCKEMKNYLQKQSCERFRNVYMTGLIQDWT